MLSHDRMEFRDKNVIIRDHITEKASESILYGGWFLRREDATRLEQVARDVLGDVLSSITGNVIAECGHITHTFCGKDKTKQLDFLHYLTGTMPVTVTIDLVGLRFSCTGPHFISAFVPDPSIMGLSTNDHPHVTALRLKQTAPVQSNKMLADPDSPFIAFPKPITVVFYAGAVLSTATHSVAT